MDPISEHCPDLLCHLGVRTRTLWVICCLFTSEEKQHTGYCLSNLSFFLFHTRWWVPCSPCWPLPASLATFCICHQWNHQLAEPVHFGNVVRLCCCEKPAVCYWRLPRTRDHLLILCLDSSLIPPFCPGWPRPILLPDFRGLHHLKWCISTVVRSGDQRKDNGGDNARLQPSELQDQLHWKFWHTSVN